MTWLIGKNKALEGTPFLQFPCCLNKKGVPFGEARGFSFVELMLAMVILCAGLILIIQGFIVAAGALNTAQNYLAAHQFLDNKMQEIDLTARENNGIEKDNQQGSFSSATRNFTWNLDIASAEKTEELDLSEDLNEVRLGVSWQERNQPNDLTVITYLKNKKENE